MKTFISATSLLTVLSLTFTNLELKAQNIEISITGIRSPKGQISIQAFTDNESFRNEKPVFTKVFKKKLIENGNMNVSIFLKPGTYGLALLDDEDCNNKMKYELLGKPSEGFGFSNYYLNELKKPHFDKFKFKVCENKIVKIIIKIKYL